MKTVKDNTPVTVYGTEKSIYLKTGQAYIVSPDLAQTLIKKGQATLEQVEEKPKAEKTSTKNSKKITQ